MSASVKVDDENIADEREDSVEQSDEDDTEGEDQPVGVLPQQEKLMVDKTSLSVNEHAGGVEEACCLDEAAPVFECPVCLQIASFPVRLPCTHIFCFLCVKGFANRSKRCALCRQEIPADFFNDPKLICKEEVQEKSKAIFDEGYQWFYEGRNGWWQYDDRTSTELERRYKDEEKCFELLIAGFLYVIDLDNMRQFRRNDQTRRRRIKRDMQNITGIKGIAGLKFNENQAQRPGGDGQPTQASGGGNSNTAITGPSTSNHGDGVLPSVVNHDTGPSLPNDDPYLIPPSAPNNTPQTPMTPADSQPSSLSNSTEDLSVHFRTQMNLAHPSGSPRSSPINDNVDENDDEDDDVAHFFGDGHVDNVEHNVDMDRSDDLDHTDDLDHNDDLDQDDNVDQNDSIDSAENRFCTETSV